MLRIPSMPLEFRYPPRWAKKERIGGKGEVTDAGI